MPKWSCDETRGQKHCRNPHGCHCREIEALSFRVAALRPIVEAVAKSDPVFTKGREAKKLVADARAAISFQSST